ncbi:MAG: glycosyltransferase [Ruminococcaceae bacterium]|nr:glycosyltransferase [Oscillospiraceae bacterium]
MNEKISVIVPVYKVEPYLCRCVESILSQSYTNLEIILVNDGSPDNCPAICDYYVEKENRVVVVHKPNGGLSSARNAGLDIATGDWISFIDSDDWIEPNMYETLISNAVANAAQISIGGVADELLTDNGTIITKTSNVNSNVTEVRDKMSAISHFLSNPWSAWDKIYRREVFENIRFPVGEINEDEAIALQLLDKCERVVYTNEVFYHYIKRPESITTSSFSPKKFAWYRHCRENLAWIRKHYPELTELAAARYRTSLLWTLTEVALSDNKYPHETKELITELKQIRRNFPKIEFAFQTDRIRMWMICTLPFGIYRCLIRIKRRRGTT